MDFFKHFLLSICGLNKKFLIIQKYYIFGRTVCINFFACFWIFWKISYAHFVGWLNKIFIIEKFYVFDRTVRMDIFHLFEYLENFSCSICGLAEQIFHHWKSLHVLQNSKYGFYYIFWILWKISNAQFVSWLNKVFIFEIFLHVW